MREGLRLKAGGRELPRVVGRRRIVLLPTRRGVLSRLEVLQQLRRTMARNQHQLIAADERPIVPSEPREGLLRLNPLDDAGGFSVVHIGTIEEAERHLRNSAEREVHVGAVDGHARRISPD